MLYFQEGLEKEVVALLSLLLYPFLKPNFKSKINTYTAHSVFFQSLYFQLPPQLSLIHICEMGTRGRGVTYGRS